MSMTRAVIIDLDGTLYDARARRERCFPEGGKKDFDRWNAEAHEDMPNSWCAELVQAMRATGSFPIFVSGRDGTYEPQTRAWLKRNLNLTDQDYLLYMRPAGDYRKDTELKREIFDTHLRNAFDVRFCVDDRRQVVEMWRELGLVCLQCDEGEF